MTSEEKRDMIMGGAREWNIRRETHPEMNITFSHESFNGADFSRFNFSKSTFLDCSFIHVDLNDTNFRKASLSRSLFTFSESTACDFREAELTRVSFRNTILNFAFFSKANLREAIFDDAYLGNADLSYANLSGAHFRGANLSYANLSGANLSGAIFVGTNLTGANLTNCSIHGISVWNVQLAGTKQENLVITTEDEPTITVDNIKVAQFIYLLLNNEEIKEVIDTIAKKAVLILGRFTPERKSILEAIRTALRSQGYLPILFDFQKPDSQDLTGTVSTLANISRFIIADLTDPSCSPYEIGLIAPFMKPIKPLFQPSKVAMHEFAMFQDLRKRYSWVLSVYRYKDQENLLASMQEKVIEPAEKSVQMLEKKKRH